MSVGALIISLEANIAKYSSDMGKAAAIAEQRMAQIDKSIGLVKTSMQALGSAVLVGLTFDKIKSSIQGAIESAAGLQQLAIRTGATVQGLSAIASVAKQSGMDAESLGVSLQKLAKSMNDASNGGAKNVEAFRAIGIGIDDIKGKKPDEMFVLIAKRMAEYADGTGKTALAQQLLGKSGANQLVVMRDLASVGELVAKVTKEQAAQAEEYEKNLRRVEMAQGAVYKVIAFQLLPVLNAFSEAMLEIIKGGNGVNGVADSLAKDNAIQEWAKSAASGVAWLVDAFDLVGRAAAVAMVTIRSSKEAFSFKETKSAANDFASGQVMAKNWHDQIEAILMREQFSTILARRMDGIGKYNFSNTAGAGRGSQGVSAKPDVLFNPTKDGSSANAANDGESFIKQLMRKVAGEQQDAFAMLRLQAAQKGVSDQAERYIKILESDEKQKKRTKQLAQEITHDLAFEAEQRAKVSSAVESGNAQAAAIIRETELLGLNAEEQRKVIELRKVDTAIQQAMAGASADTVVELLKLSEVMKGNVVAALDANIKKQNELNASWQTGATAALDSYLKSVQNVAAKMEGAITSAFQAMEDALVKFVMTGKLDFASLANSIIENMVRITIQESIMGPLAAGFKAGGLSGMFSAGASILGFAGGGSPPVGVPSIVGEHGPEIFVPSSAGTIIPNSSIGGQAITNIININATVGDVASKSDVVAGMRMTASQIAAQMARNQRYGGSLA